MQASAATAATTPVSSCRRFLQRRGRRGARGARRRADTDTTTVTTVTRCYGEPGADNQRDGRNKSPSIQNIGSAARLEVMRPKPLFTVGLFADAQYADKDDYERPSEKGRVKYFRAVPDRLRAALADFKSRGEGIACIINLGDIIDGVNDDDVTVEVPTRKGPLPEELAAKNRSDLNRMAAIVRRGSGAIPVYHCLGNHDLNVPRDEVTKILGNPRGAAYFTVKLPRRWRLVVLDTTDVNPRYLEPGSEAQAAGEAYVREAKARDNNAAQVKPWGGGVGTAQMEWLASELRAAEVGVAQHTS